MYTDLLLWHKNKNTRTFYDAFSFKSYIGFLFLARMTRISIRETLAHRNRSLISAENSLNPVGVSIRRGREQMFLI